NPTAKSLAAISVTLPAAAAARRLLENLRQQLEIEPRLGLILGFHQGHNPGEGFGLDGGQLRRRFGILAGKRSDLLAALPVDQRTGQVPPRLKQRLLYRPGVLASLGNQRLRLSFPVLAQLELIGELIEG